jgi:hypothetical protein
VSKKMPVVAATIALSLGLVGTFGAGVAAAKNGKNQNGGAVVHGNHGPKGATHDGSNVGGGPSDQGTTGATGGTGAVGPNPGNATAAHGQKGTKKGRSVAVTGATTCSVHGKVAFNPPLVTGGTASSTVTVTGLLNRCHSASQTNVKFNNGHLSGLVGSVSPNDCASLAGVAPALSGGTIKWTPPSKVAGSSDVSMPAGTASVNTSGKNSVIAFAYSGGSVGSGSFTNTGGTSMTVTSRQDTTQVSGRCTTGLHILAFSGTATL